MTRGGGGGEITWRVENGLERELEEGLEKGLERELERELELEEGLEKGVFRRNLDPKMPGQGVMGVGGSQGWLRRG